jgi:hypothetical protein
MLDCFSEQLASLVQIIAGVEHALDLRAILGPLFNLVEIAIVRQERAIGCSSGQSSDQSSLMPAGEMLKATMPTVTLFVAIVPAFLAFCVAAYFCDRTGRMFIAAFLSAGAWLCAAALAFVIWRAFRQ